MNFIVSKKKSQEICLDRINKGDSLSAALAVANKREQDILKNVFGAMLVVPGVLSFGAGILGHITQDTVASIMLIFAPISLIGMCASMIECYSEKQFLSSLSESQTRDVKVIVAQNRNKNHIM